ncbi:MAG: DUF2267 domain-containing protein [Candidatus Rokubacteria bacterium]|nr:DUF2267 domain-containing protein [Candidatus Rokubacteria bacterium]
MREQDFIVSVQHAAGLPGRKEAMRWSRAVAAALLDLAPDAETRRKLITELPGFLKSHLRDRAPHPLSMDREALIQHVGAALDLHAPDARRALLAVWGVMRRAVSPGEIAAFAARLSADIAVLLETAA